MTDIDWGGLIKNYGPAAAYMLAQLWGAKSQNDAQGANLDAMNQRNAMLQGYINPLLIQQQGQSPYAQAIAQFIGRPGLGAPQGTAQNPYPIPNDWRKVRYDPITGKALPPATITNHKGQQIDISTGQPPSQNPYASIGASGTPVFGNGGFTPTQSADQFSVPQGYTSDGATMVNQQGQGMPEENAPPSYEQLVAQLAPHLGDAGARQAAASMLASRGDFSGAQAWDQQNASAREEQRLKILNDPSTSPEARALVQNPLWNTLEQNSRMAYGQPMDAAQQAYASQYGQNMQNATPGAQPNGYNTNDQLMNWSVNQGPLPASFSNGIGQFPGQGPTLGGMPDPWGPTDTGGQPTNPFGGGSSGPGPQFDPTGGGVGMGSGGMFQYKDPGMDAFTYKPPTLGEAPTVTGLQGMNAGQDALMQMMRAGGQSYGSDQGPGSAVFNNSELFKSLEPLDQRLIDRNVSQLRAGTGSLGQRFGTAMAQNEGRLREQLGQDVLARNAGLASQSFENAQNRSLQSGLGLASSLGQSDQLNQQAKLANQGVAAQYGLHGADIANQAGQFNAQQRMGQHQFATGQGNIYNQFTLGALGQMAGLDQQKFGNQANLISLLAGLPMGQQQASAYPGALGDISQMAMLFPFLQSMMGGGGGQRAATPTGTPSYSPFWPA